MARTQTYAKGDEPVPGFRLVEFLGKGGFGEVWKATAPGGTHVAVKIINLTGKQGLKEFRAIRLVKLVRHPNLVPITAFWLKDESGKLLHDTLAEEVVLSPHSVSGRATSSDGGPCPAELIIAMGLGDKNLLDRLKESQGEGRPGIPADELLDYMEDAAKAIDHLNSPRHDLGQGPVAIQHCDIKPHNVMIVGGAAQVCDFGLACVLGEFRDTIATVSAAYGAPEMLRDNKPSPHTDQYSLAITYVELRTGSLPFEANSFVGVINAHVEGKLNLSRLPPAEQAVIRRATSLRPTERYSSTIEMVRALRQAHQQRMVVTPAPPPRRLSALITGGSEIVPGYKLLRLLGKGGYGEVWEAIAPGGRHVAVKIIQNLEGVKGRQEFKALELIKGVDHDHLLEVHAYWLLDREGQPIPDELRDQPDAPAPSMLVIAGRLAAKNLIQRLDECLAATKQGIPLDELLAYMRQVALAIDHLNAPIHQLGDRKVSIQHRDIKPENILLVGNTAKVGDFGLAKVLEGSSAIIHRESTGLTLAYAAPEVFDARVTCWTDQYSLAVTYYKLRSGVLPFPAKTPPAQLIDMHRKGQLDFRRLPSAELEVIKRATAIVPEQRYPSCVDMVKALEKACGTAGTTGGSWPPPADDPHARTRTGPDSRSAPTPSERTAARSGQSRAVAELAPTAYEGGLPSPSLTQSHNETQAAPVVVQQPTEAQTRGLAGLLQPSRLKAMLRDRRVQIALGAAAVVLVAVGILLYIFRDGPQAAEEKQIRQLAGEQQFLQAYQRLKKANLSAKSRETLTAEVLTAWQNWAKEPLEAGLYQRALQRAEEILSEVAGNPDAEAVRTQAIMCQDIEKAIGDYRYKDAFEKISNPNIKWLPGLQDKLRQKALQAGLPRADEAVRTGLPDHALSICAELRIAFPQDERITAIEKRAKAQIEELEKRPEEQVKRAIHRKEFEKALRFIEIGNLDGKLKDQFREQALSEWWRDAEPKLKTGKLDDALSLVQACSDLMKKSLSHQHAKKIRDAALPPLLAALVKRLEEDIERAAEIRAQLNQLIGALSDPADVSFRVQALLARARALARLPEPAWEQVRQDLAEVDKLKPLKPEQQGYVLVLKLLSETDPAKGLTHLKELKNSKLPALAKWETEQVPYGQKMAVQGAESALAKAVDAKKALELAQLILDVDPQNAEAKGHQAELQALEIPSEPAKRAAAAETLTKLIAVPRPRRPAQLCLALIALAEKDPAHRMAAINAVEPALSKAKSTEVNGGFYRLIDLEVESRVPKLAQPQDFKVALALCSKVPEKEASARVLLCKLECLLEEKRETADEVIRLRDAVEAIDAKARQPVAVYEQYLMALLKDAGGKPDLDVAADGLLKAFAKEPLPAELNDHRLGRAVALWEKAAKGKVQELLKEPFKPLMPAERGEVEKVAAWLKRPQEILTQQKKVTSPDLRIFLALALGQKEKLESGEVALVRTLTGQLLDKAGREALAKSHGNSVIYALLLGSARSHSRSTSGEDTVAALASHAELLDLLKTQKEFEKVPYLELYRSVIEPAVELEKKLVDPGLRKQADPKLAQVHAAKGKLILANKYETWPFDKGDKEKLVENRIRAALAAYEEATRLDDSRAEYFVRKCIARSQLPNQDPKDLLIDAMQARDKDPRTPGGHGLLGYVYYLQSLRLKAASEKAVKLRDAVAALGTAIELCKKTRDPENEEAAHLINRSISYVSLANNASKRNETESSLKLALADANRAIDELRCTDPEAFMARGNAYEDLASLAGDKARYADADAAFEDAVTANPRWADAWCGRGRNQFKAVRLGKEDPGKLDAAAKYLRQAILLDANYADAHYFLGLVWLAQKKYAESDTALHQAVTLAKAQDSPFATLYLEVWARDACEEGIRLLNEDVKSEAGLDRLKVAQQKAEELRNPTAPTVARVLGKALEYQGDLAAALKAYNRGLPEQLDRSHIELLLERTSFFLDGRRRRQLQTLKLLPKDEEILDDANRLMNLIGDPATGDPLTTDLTRGAAHYVASEARVRPALAQSTENRAAFKRLLEEANDHLRQALKFAPNHPDVFTWKKRLAQQLLTIIPEEKDASVRQQWAEEGRRQLREARQINPTGDLGKLQEDYDKLKP